MTHPLGQNDDRARFVARYGAVYERSPWVAEAVWETGQAIDDPRALTGVMRLIVDQAGAARQLTLLRAHPDLAGRVAIRNLTEASASEQTGAGLDQCSPEEAAAFHRLNADYTEKFGFPFILAVKGHTRHSILAAFHRRIENDPEIEFAEALAQVHRIAEQRLLAMAEEDA
ncbi:MAG: 2-oxo-4-hydroxy-4-carboxy-5-ureidoimidazoline decarboxylase [Pseudomonadota bacterium]